MTNKRTFSYVMDIEQEDSSKTSKRKNIEVEGELVEVTKIEGKKK